MHNLPPIMLATNPIFIEKELITLSKLHAKFQPHPLKDFLKKGVKSEKKLNYAQLIPLNKYFRENYF